VDVPMTISYVTTSPTPAQSGELALASRRRERPAARSRAPSLADDSTELVECSDGEEPMLKRKTVFRRAASPDAPS
jgi:hypothetical protein